MRDPEAQPPPSPATTSSPKDLYFGPRGVETFDGFALVDFGVNYSIPVWGRLRPYAKFEVLNVFNNQKLIGFDRTVTADNNGPKDETGLPLNHIEGPRFGEATRNLDYPAYRPGFDGSRTFLMAFGFRF